VLVIGENINASNKSVGQAIQNKDRQFLSDLARAQSSAGAHYIDVNAGTGQGWESSEAAMEWLVELVQEAVDKPLVIDSDVPSILEAALRRYRGDRVIVNSVNAEPEKLNTVGSLVIEHKAMVVALAMGRDGIPNSVDARLGSCEVIMSSLAKQGIREEQVFFDPLVLPISVDSNQALVTLNTIREIRSRYPSARTIMGLSNVSFGLPQRPLINRSFLLMAAYAGLDAAIMNPLDKKMMSIVHVAEMLTGKDISCRAYIRAYRKGLLAD
jgi:5-methyltetrahydrofolate corrinoid/iron sulfur protein methyltransferase